MRARLIDINGSLVLEDDLKGVDVYPDVIRFRHRTFVVQKSSTMNFNLKAAIYNECVVYWITHG